MSENDTTTPDQPTSVSGDRSAGAAPREPAPAKKATRKASPRKTATKSAASADELAAAAAAAAPEPTSRTPAKRASAKVTSKSVSKAGKTTSKTTSKSASGSASKTTPVGTDEAATTSATGAEAGAATTSPDATASGTDAPSTPARTPVRRASRKAAPPAQTLTATEPADASVGSTGSVSAPTSEAPVPDASTGSGEPTKKTSRRSAKRSAGAPATQVQPEPQPAAPDESPAAAAAATDEQSEPAAPRRATRSARRPAGAAPVLFQAPESAPPVARKTAQRSAPQSQALFTAPGDVPASTSPAAAVLADEGVGSEPVAEQGTEPVTGQPSSRRSRSRSRSGSSSAAERSDSSASADARAETDVADDADETDETDETAVAPEAEQASGDGDADGDGDETAGDGTQTSSSRRRRRGSRGRGRKPSSASDDESGESVDGGQDGADGTSRPAAGAADDTDGSDDTDGPDGSDEQQGRSGSSGTTTRSSSSSRSRSSRSSKSSRPAADAEATATDDEEAADDSETSTEPGEGSSSSSRRRRRRRRSGDAVAPAPDDPPQTVVKVRSTRPAGSDDVTGVSGSTRLEAKKQRRRDGRDQARRRTPILTEAEFLARRESVDRVMVVRQTDRRTQIAVLEDGILVEHYVTQSSQTSYVGNVYLGRVQNVLPAMEAAFVDIGKGRNGVLYAGEVAWSRLGLEGKPKRIESVLSSGSPVLVQVTKDPVAHKGARLTGMVSLPGRFLVYAPGGSMSGISRKLPEEERARLKAIVKKVFPDEASVIIRTAAEGASEEELTRDVKQLESQWQSIETKLTTASAPSLLYAEPDLAIKVVRDMFNEDIAGLVISGDEAWETLHSYVMGVAPDLIERLTRWDRDEDVFAAHRVDEQLAKALERKVYLPSGGSLVIDRTEAMTVVDVNTGKFTGSGGSLEETVTKNNLEAAEEIVRQIRLRDIGGIIVIDFIDMVLENNRDLVLRRLVECLGRDRTRHQVAEVTSLGLVQMTRKRVGQGLLEAFSEPCEHCGGRGIHVRQEPVESRSRQGDDEPESRGGSSSGDTPKKAKAPSESGSRSRRGRSSSADQPANGSEPKSNGETRDPRSTEAIRAMAAAMKLAPENGSGGHDTAAAPGDLDADQADDGAAPATLGDVSAAELDEAATAASSQAPVPSETTAVDEPSIATAASDASPAPVTTPPVRVDDEPALVADQSPPSRPRTRRRVTRPAGAPAPTPATA